MGRGYFLVRGDKTTCGGKIIEGADDHTIMGGCGYSWPDASD